LSAAATSNGQAPRPVDTALEFLRTLWPDPPDGYLLLFLLPGEECRWFRAADPEALAAAAVKASADRDVYLQCALSPRDFGPHNRCKAADVRALPGLWADVDVRGPAHRRAELPPDVLAATDLCRAMPRPPSLFVLSGWGVYPWWLFKEPWDLTDPAERERAKDLARRWQAHLHALAAERGWRLDSATADFARVLRLPGTLNHKLEPRPVTLELSGRLFRYDPSDLLDALPPEEPRHTRAGGKHAGGGGSPADRARALEALARLSPKRAEGYDTWLAVGMALHSVDASDAMLAEWDNWSKLCREKYEGGACAEKWATFGLDRDRKLTLGSLVWWAGQDAGGKRGRRKAAAVILDYMLAVYAPAFRRGDRVWSATLRAEVRRGDVLARCCDSAMMGALVAQALEMPCDRDGQVRPEAAPRVYRDYAPVAWGDLLGQTPDEPEAEEVEPSAELDFRRRLSAALTRIITLGRNDPEAGRRGEDGPDREARSILDWCRLFAKPGGWAKVRSYYVWCRLERPGTDRDADLRVAIRPELLGQLGLRDLEGLGQDRLADLAERYGVGCRCRAGRGGQRAIELDPEWLRGLLEAPGPREGDGEGDTGHAPAQARESGVTPSP
jgi:hypothetical protein